MPLYEDQDSSQFKIKVFPLWKFGIFYDSLIYFFHFLDLKRLKFHAKNCFFCLSNGSKKFYFNFHSEIIKIQNPSTIKLLHFFRTQLQLLQSPMPYNIWNIYLFFPLYLSKCINMGHKSLCSFDLIYTGWSIWPTNFFDQFMSSS